MKRTISAAGIQLFDKLLASNPLAAACIENKQPRQLLVEAAKACLGIHEQGGDNRGPEVEIFQQTVGVVKGDSWCMAFVQACIAYVEAKTGVSSPLAASGAVMDVWSETDVSQRVQQIPLAGAIAIWQHTQNPAHGHTGIVLDCDGVTFHAVEGNTSDGWDDLNGDVGKPGDGVEFTHRRFDLFNPQKGDMQLRGFLRPF